jgi:hypothetical protein
VAVAVAVAVTVALALAVILGMPVTRGVFLIVPDVAVAVILSVALIAGVAVRIVTLVVALAGAAVPLVHGRIAARVPGRMALCLVRLARRDPRRRLARLAVRDMERLLGSLARRDFSVVPARQSGGRVGCGRLASLDACRRWRSRRRGHA